MAFIFRTRNTLISFGKMAESFRAVGMEGTAETIEREAETLRFNMSQQLEKLVGES